MQSNSVHRAAFVRKMNENTARKRSHRHAGLGSAPTHSKKARAKHFAEVRRRGKQARAVGTGMRALSKNRRAASMRRNKRPPTGAEARAYAAAHETIYGPAKKARKSRKAAASAPAAAAAPASTPARRARISKTVKAAQKRIKAAEKRYAAAQKGVERATTQAEAAAQREKKAIEKAKIRIDKMKIAEAARNTPEKVARRKRAAVKRKWPKQSRTQGRGKTKRRVRVAYGPYRRASLSHPRRGGRVLSYMTRSKGKALRKIPAWAIAGAISAKDYKTEGAYQKAKTRIAARRKAAAKRAEAGWDAFTPNSGAGHMYENKSKKKKKKKKAASRKGKKRSKASRSKAARKAAATRKRNKAARAAGRKKSPKKKARKSSKRSKAARKAAATRKRNKAARAAGRAKPSRKGKRKSKAGKKSRRSKSRRVRMPRRIGRRKVRRLRKGLYFIANRRRGGRYTMNGFASDLKTLLKTGALVLTGFFIHKALTGVVAKALVSADGTKFAGMALMTADGKISVIGQWAKPLTGAVVGAAGIAAVSMVPGKAETRMAVGAGMMVSWLESVVRTALLASDQTKTLSYLEGYSNSAASALRGSGRYVPRHLRRSGAAGLGVARNATSIMPQFVPIGAVGPQFTQAASGMGEFFTPQSGMGEYFAGPGTQGVGFYEKAGPLALQPGRSHMGQLPVDDGIRPDANLDHVLDLAESAAGLGQGATQASAGFGSFTQAHSGMGRSRGVRGMGEFFTASPSGDGFAENSVPTQSQWIPNGPLWAGSTPAEAHYTESELPAGILQGSGGNGVLSGG